jgi:hypothetical protein
LSNLRRIELYFTHGGPPFLRINREPFWDITACVAVRSMIASYNNRNPNNALEYVKVVIKQSERSTERNWTLAAHAPYTVAGTPPILPIDLSVVDKWIRDSRYGGMDDFK